MVCIVAKQQTLEASQCFEVKRTPDLIRTTRKKMVKRNSCSSSSSSSRRQMKSALIKTEFHALMNLLPSSSGESHNDSSTVSSSPLEVVLHAIQYIQQLEAKLGGAAEAKKKFHLRTTAAAYL